MSELQTRNCMTPKSGPWSRSPAGALLDGWNRSQKLLDGRVRA